MASLFAHAALPLVALSAFRSPPGLERRLAVAAVVCSCLPDLDMVTFVFEVRATALIGHRGITHSLLAAAVISLAAAILAFRKLGVGSPAWWRVAAFLFGVTASHGLLDAMTHGEVGVALFAPIDNARHSFPFTLLPSAPVGLNEFFGYWGVLTIANELLYAVLPLAILVSFLRARNPENRESRIRPRLVRASVAWFAIAIVLRTFRPDIFAPTVPRILMPVGTKDAGDLALVPTADLPGGKLVTKLRDLRALGLFDRTLATKNAIWSSSFFPAWFGGEAGRWSDGSVRLASRTLFGFSPPSEREAKEWLASAAAGDAVAQNRIFTLAPTEKVDLALGRLDFPASVEGLTYSHNGKPRYWGGRCNGIAAAAMTEPEPFRVVDVIGVDGSRIRFHPNDIKALLSVAFYNNVEVGTMIGGMCQTVAFDAEATCSMNPAALLVIVLNRLGLAQQSFLVDALPTIAKQYYAVAGARVHVHGEPRAVGDAAMDPSLTGRAASLVDVDLELTLSSTTLAYARANMLDPASSDGSRYQRVGLVPSVFSYHATIVLDANEELIGGRWTGDPADGPDDVILIPEAPSLDAKGILPAASHIPWTLVRDLAKASIDEGPDVPTLDLRPRP